MTTEYIIIINLEDLWLLIYILYAYVYIIYGLGWFIIYIPAESYRSGGGDLKFIKENRHEPTEPRRQYSILRMLESPQT